MSKYEYFKGLVSQFSGNANSLVILKPYAELTGDLNTGLILNQCVFYSGITKRTDGYFYKSYDEWQEETTLSEYQVRRSVNKLKKAGLVETKRKKANGAPTLHYKVNFDALESSILKELKDGYQRNSSNDTEETQGTLTENYTENYTENIYIRELFNYWNDKEIIKHRELTKKRSSSINARLKSYTVDELKLALDNYKEVLDNDKYYWTHKYNLEDFMNPRNLERFTKEAKPFDNFLSNNYKSGNKKVATKNKGGINHLID